MKPTPSSWQIEFNWRHDFAKINFYDQSHSLLGLALACLKIGKLARQNCPSLQFFLYMYVRTQEGNLFSIFDLIF